MTDLRAAGTLLAADPGSRTLTYRLLPYGEPGRTNLGVITASAGTVELPAAADVVLNLEHERRRPLARGSALVDTAAGLDASFVVADTAAGNDLLAEAAAGLRTGASVELDDVVIRDGRLVSARLVGAAAVVDPAFPSAQLAASDVGDTPDDDTDDTDDDTDEDQVSEAATPDDDTDDTDDDTDSEADMTTTDTTTAAAGTLAATRAPAGLPTPRTAPPEPGFREIVRLLAAAGRTGSGVQGHLLATLQAAAPRSTELFAALADITPGAASVNDLFQVPQWLGEVWDGRDYQRRYIPLLTSAPLTAMEIKGWKWVIKPEVAPYAGNKAAVPSNAPTTEPYVLTAQRIAGAHDIDRIFRDFNVEEFWSSYWAAMAESYARQSDSVASALLLDSAPYHAPGAVPAGVSKAASYIVDGALAIIDTALPTFAIVSKDLYRDLLLTRTEDVLAYLNLALGLEDGSVASFSIVPGDATFPADTVIVGAKPAATFYELPGSPLRVEALNIANGGVDVGLFGYVAAGFNDDGGLAYVSATPPAAADEDDETATSSRRGRRSVKAKA
jgi:hypothetical protein